MRLFRILPIAVGLGLAAAISGPELHGAKAPKAPSAKAPKPPKPPAPKVRPQKTAPAPKPNRVIALSPQAKASPRNLPKKGGPTAKPPSKQPGKIIKREVNVHRFAEFNERTRAYSFHAHWWYRFVIYPSRAGRYVVGPINYTIVVPPANVPAPPVIKAGQGLPMAASGTDLAVRLDGMDVEKHWLSGQTVNWKTGNRVSDDKGPASNGGAFVAGVCARLKVPMAEPAADNFLPDSQYDWFVTEGKSKGWIAVDTVEAQLLANQGWVVVAAWKNPAAVGEPTLAGQTAIVRPSGNPAIDIPKNGPHVIMAGKRNHNDIAVKNAFPEGGKDVIYVACRPR